MKEIIKRLVKRIPLVESIARRFQSIFLAKTEAPKVFPGSGHYWETRYSDGADSGAGSYGNLAKFKAEVLNGFVETHDVQSVIEFGCGDGNQLGLAEYASYIGFDVSSTAILKCIEQFKSDDRKAFYLMSEYKGERADLSISLDVVYHLVEDAVFGEYMRMLFDASNSYVIVYSSNHEQTDGCESSHVKHRKFTNWVAVNEPNWKLVDQLPNRYPYSEQSQNGSFAEFFIFKAR